MAFYVEYEVEVKKRQARVMFLNKVREYLPNHESEQVVTAGDVANGLRIPFQDALDALHDLKRMKLVDCERHEPNKTKPWWKAKGKF